LHFGAFSDSEISKEEKLYFFLKKNVTVPIKKCFLTKAFAKGERMDFVTIVTQTSLILHLQWLP
jgi:hypothetical protein